jgi:hypothetical protein
MVGLDEGKCDSASRAGLALPTTVAVAVAVVVLVLGMTMGLVADRAKREAGVYSRWVPEEDEEMRGMKSDRDSNFFSSAEEGCVYDEHFWRCYQCRV